MNKCILIGNLTRDPELTQTPSGTALCKFTIAVNRNYTNAEGEREADFINIVAWRTTAENCGKYLTKGSKVAVCGQIQTSSYDADDGTKRYRTDVVAQDVEFIKTSDKEAAESTQAAKAPPKKKATDLKPVEDDGLPF